MANHIVQEAEIERTFHRRNVVGKLLNFRGLVYAPVNENGVIFLFSKVANDLNFYVETIRTGFPDCIAKRYIGNGQWEEVRIEFEFASSNFVRHRHDPKECDVIVCWDHDWTGCPKKIEVIELKSAIQGLENEEIKEPDKIEKEQPDLKKLFKQYGAGTEKLAILLKRLLEDPKKKIWPKVHKRGLTFYSPDRVFVYVDFQKNGLRFTLYTGGKRLNGVTPIEYDRGGEKWGRMWVTSAAEVKKSTSILREACRRVNEAITRHENTGWYSEVA